MNDASAFIAVDENGNKYLKSTSSSRSRDRVPANQVDRNPNGWIQYAVYFWLFRLGMGSLGALVPTIIAMFLGQHLSTPLTPSVDVIHQIDWAEAVSADHKLFHEIRSQRQPVVFHSVPTNGNATIRMLLRGLVQSHELPVKISKSAHFMHFAGDRHWSAELLPSRGYDVTNINMYLAGLCDGNYSFVDSMRSPSTSADQPLERCFLYSSFPGLLPYLESFAPSLNALTEHAEQAQLWLSSPGVSAAWHYDSLDNLLLQVHGSKTVSIIPPQSCMQTYSSLHPYHRQALIAGCSNQSVELRAGDMLYIPAGHWHSVLTGTDSVSVNLWLQSTHTALLARLRTLAPSLVGAHSVADRAARIGAMARQLCRLLDLSPNCLAHRLMNRLQGGTSVCTETVCSQWDQQRAETSVHSKRSARELHAVLHQHLQQNAPMELLMLAVADLLEEALLTVFTIPPLSDDDDEIVNSSPRELTPASMQAAIEQCFIMPHVQ